ncbi:MAG: DUF1501 domain-containing protein [Gammaproteobacteria bacterium]|nr:DUF1501 domain-containing protein [Gammaproteobacteria bacterium]
MKAQYQSITSSKPLSLFSHLDQQRQWQAAISARPSESGWGGRIAEILASINSASSIPAMISTAGNNLFVTGASTHALSIPTSGTFGYHGFANSDGVLRANALSQLLGVDNQNDLIAAAQQVATSAISSAAILNPILTNTTTPVSTPFAALTSNIAKQLLAVAKIIEAQTSIGAARQIFMVNLGGFDTHSNQLATQVNLLGQLGPAMKAFYDAMTAIGAINNVTAFTLSDFSRTY